MCLVLRFTDVRQIMVFKVLVSFQTYWCRTWSCYYRRLYFPAWTHHRSILPNWAPKILGTTSSTWRSKVKSNRSGSWQHCIALGRGNIRDIEYIGCDRIGYLFRLPLENLFQIYPGLAPKAPNQFVPPFCKLSCQALNPNMEDRIIEWIFLEFEWILFEPSNEYCLNCFINGGENRMRIEASLSNFATSLSNVLKKLKHIWLLLSICGNYQTHIRDIEYWHISATIPISSKPTFNNSVSSS